MNQESADEFLGRNSHHARPVFIPVAVIPPLEADLTIGDIPNAVIGEGDAMCVTPQIIENLAGSSKRRFGIDYPFALLQRFEIVEKGGLLFQRFDFADELNLIPLECFFQSLEKKPAKQTR